MAPHHIHRACPLLLEQGAGFRLGELVAVNDVGGPQILQQGMGLGLAGAGRHLETQFGQDGHGEDAHPAAGAGHQHRALLRFQVKVEQPFDAHGRGLTGGAEHHAAAGVQLVRAQRHPARRHPDILAEAAGGVHTEVVAGDDHLVAGLELLVG